MANAQIKITQLPNIGNNLGSNTILPVVNTSGTAITEKVTVGNVANFILNEAGNLLPVAGVAEIAYSVANAAQPNITSVGNLTGLTITNLSNFHLPGGTNGYVLQTNGDGNLSWTAQTGGGGNGTPGGSNSQIQFNNSGAFGGDPELTWDAANNQLNTVNIGVSGITVYGNLSTVNATVTTNLTGANANISNLVANTISSNTLSATGNITANFFIGNGSALTGITATANGAGPNNSIQYNSNGGFAGDANLSWNSNTETLSTNNISVTGNVTSNIVDANYLYGDGSNISNISNISSANFANYANLANFVTVESVNNNFSYHVVLTTGPGDSSLHNDSDDSFQYNPQDGTLTVTRVDAQFLQTGNLISNLIPFSNITYNLGSNTHRWKDIWLANSTIHLGDSTLSANGNNVIVSGLSISGGNIGNIGNIASINLDGSSSNVLYGNGVFAPASGGGNADLGNLQITGTTIDIANGASETSISIGTNSASMTVDTDSGAPVLNLQVQSTDNQYYEESFDYTSGTWVTNGLEGTLTITGYSPSFETFLNGLGQYQSFTITINGSETTATNGYSYGGGTVTFYTILPPGVDPTNVSNIVFNTVFSNKLLMDPDEGDMGIYIGDFNFEIESQRDIRIVAGDDFNIRANDGFEMRANSDFQVTTNYNNAQQSWTFDSSGNLSLPGGGSLYSLPSTPSGAPGNTIVLQPAGPSFITDQKLMVYPTAGDGDHIHMTTGNLYQTELFLGSDNFFVKLSNTGNVVINPNDNISYSATWTFSPNGNLVLANGNSVIYSTPNSSLDPINPNVSTMTLTPDANYNYQALVLDPTAPGHIHLRGPSGTGNIDNPAANLFLGGEASSFEVGASYGDFPNVYVHSNNYTWTFGTDGNLTLPGTPGRYIKGPEGGYAALAVVDDGTDLPAQLVSINSNSGTGTTAISAYANNALIQANINGDIKTWTFDNTGNMILPGNTFAVNYANGVQVSLGGSNYGNSNVANFLASFGSNTISTTGNANVGNLGVATVVATANISTTGYFISGNQATGGFQLGNSNSRLKSGDSNSYMTMGQNPAINPDTAANPSAGVLIGGNGYLLGNNGARNITLNYANTSGLVGLQANVQVGTGGSGAVLVPGTVNTGVNSILAGPTFTPLANTMAGFVSNVNSYTQLTIQNKNTGADATVDFIATADNGTDTVNYIDLGIINSGYDANTPTNSLGNIVYAADGYLYAQGNTSNTSQSGGNLVIGTSTPGKNVKIFVGGVNNSAIMANISNTGMTINGNVVANNFSGNISITGNVTGTSPNVQLVAGSYTYTFDNTGVMTLPAPASGNEGGEIQFIQAGNSTLSGNTVTVDSYVDQIRFFEGGGTARGAYIDLSQAAAGVGTLLNNRVSGLVNAGTFVTMDNIKATVTSSAPRGLSLATVSGTFTYNIGGTYGSSGVGSSGSSAGGQTLTTTPTGSIFGWGFTVSGDIAVYTLTDTTNNRCYRITVQIGGSFNNNSIIIERLI